MDLKTLKLELLERIALIDDVTRLLAIKRQLDAPPSYNVPNENLTVVHEPLLGSMGLEDRMYSSEEVRALLDEFRKSWEAGEPGLGLTASEWSEIEQDRLAFLRGEGQDLTWKELKERMHRDQP